MKHIGLLIDGNSLAWRCLYAGQENMQWDGTPTGMIFKFLRVLRVALDVVNATTCRVAWDAGHPDFRLKVYPDYKKKRSVKDPAVFKRFTVQKEWLQQNLGVFGVGSIVCPGWEADDVIAALLETAIRNSEDLRVVVLSSDRDIWQLVADRVAVLMPGKEQLLTLKTFKKMTGFDGPTNWFWYRVLTGDASDNIPGVPRIGEVRGKKLIEAGFPCGGAIKAALDEPDDAWHKAYDGVLTRNQQLMDLLRSGGLLNQAIQTRKTVPSVLKPALNIDQAKRTIKRVGISEMLVKWDQWTTPFRRLG